jgi:hypothetical protein
MQIVLPLGRHHCYCTDDTPGWKSAGEKRRFEAGFQPRQALVHFVVVARFRESPSPSGTFLNVLALHCCPAPFQQLPHFIDDVEVMLAEPLMHFS